MTKNFASEIRYGFILTVLPGDCSDFFTFIILFDVVSLRLPGSFFLPLKVLNSRRFSLTGPPGGCSDSLYYSWWFHQSGSLFLPLKVLKIRLFSLTGLTGGGLDSLYCSWWFHLSESFSYLCKCIKKPSFQLDWPTWRMFGFFILFVVVPPVWVFFII